MGTLKSCGHPAPTPRCVHCYVQVRAALKAAESSLNEHLRQRPTQVRVHVLPKDSK